MSICDGPFMLWRLVQSVPYRTPENSWDRLQPLHDPVLFQIIFPFKLSSIQCFFLRLKLSFFMVKYRIKNIFNCKNQEHLL